MSTRAVAIYQAEAKNRLPIDITYETAENTSVCGSERVVIGYVILYAQERG
jgi:hypothetical protein